MVELPGVKDDAFSSYEKGMLVPCHLHIVSFVLQYPFLGVPNPELASASAASL